MMSRKSQRGSVLIYGLLALFVISAGAGIVFTYNSAITRAEKAEADNTTLRQANSEFAAENLNLRTMKAHQDRILAERQGRRNAEAEIERKIDATLSKAMQQPDVRRWADTPVPGAVVDGLRVEPDRATGKDGALPAAGKPARPGAGG